MKRLRIAQQNQMENEGRRACRRHSTIKETSCIPLVLNLVGVRISTYIQHCGCFKTVTATGSPNYTSEYRHIIWLGPNHTASLYALK